MKLRGIVYNLLNFKEFPKIVVGSIHQGMKNAALAKIVAAYYQNRKNMIRSELAMLDEIESHYKQYYLKN